LPERDTTKEYLPSQDGDWSKHCHKHSCNAKSGIVGLETRKILFMGVRNKYSAVCNNLPAMIHQHTHAIKLGWLLLSHGDRHHCGGVWEVHSTAWGEVHKIYWWR